MSDARRRDAERTGDARALLGARLRSGELSPEDLAQLEYFGLPEAGLLLEEVWPAGRPRRTFRAELAELATLSTQVAANRFVLQRWPDRIHEVAREALACAAAAAERPEVLELARALVEGPASGGDPDSALVRLSTEGDPGDPPRLLALALSALQQAHRGRALGAPGAANLDLHVLPPALRLCGVEALADRIEALQRRR